jgi:hypothetical protein
VVGLVSPFVELAGSDLVWARITGGMVALPCTVEISCWQGDMSWMELSNVEELSAGYGVLNAAAMQRCAHSKLDPIGRLLCTI